jgi:hypothetical protein
MLIHYTPHAPRPFASLLADPRGCWVHISIGHLMTGGTITGERDRWLHREDRRA